MSFWSKLGDGLVKGITGNPIGILGGIGQTIFGNRSKKSAQQQAFENQKGLFDYMNKYNTPAKQMERLREAGLNPALMYGQGTTGNANSMPTTPMAVPESMAPIGNLQMAGVGMATQDSVIASNLSSGIAKLQEAKSKGLNGGTELYQNQAALLNKQAEDLDSQITNRSAQELNLKSLTRLNNQLADQQEKTGMIKGDFLGNIAKAWNIDLNTKEGKESFKEKAMILLGSQILKDTLPSLVRILEGMNILKGKTPTFNRGQEINIQNFK